MAQTAAKAGAVKKVEGVLPPVIPAQVVIGRPQQIGLLVEGEGMRHPGVANKNSLG